MHPIILKTHFFTLYSYGACVALAMTLALAVSARQSVRAGLSRADALDLLFILFVTGVLGARLFYVVQNWGYFSGDLWGVFRIQEGGLVWYGGFLLGLFCAALFCWIKKQSALRWMDFFAPIAALSHAIGRVGCFLNGCCHGRPTDLFLGIQFPDEPFRRHPVQLYESTFLAILSLVLFALARNNKKRPGSLFAVYLLCYGALRFGLEFLRIDQPLFFYLTFPQWISAALVLGAIIFILQAKRSS